MSDEREERVASPSQTAGPFFHIGLTTDAGLGKLAGPDTEGERVLLSVRVLDGEGQPVPDAIVEIWQADRDGVYAEPARLGDDTTRPTFVGFGRLPTGEDGTCTFETIRPGTGTDGQASHVNICLFARGLLRQLHTRVYFEGDPALADDPVLSFVSESRRPTLVARRFEHGHWRFDLRLQGDGETVFFDL